MGVAKLTDQNTIMPESKYARVERERRYLLADLPAGLSRADHHLQPKDPPFERADPNRIRGFVPCHARVIHRQSDHQGLQP